MADLVNPYANPYLPAFVNQRPRMNDVRPATQIPQLNMPQIRYTQIDSVNGYGGARDFVYNNLAPGASIILAESDPNTARIYICAKDSSGQTYVEGYRLVREEEPKPVTMDDLNTKMSELLDRMNKLEGDRAYGHNKSGSEPVRENGNQPYVAGPRNQSGGGNAKSSNGAANDSK
jgi:hypothetical protein